MLLRQLVYSISLLVDNYWPGGRCKFRRERQRRLEEVLVVTDDFAERDIVSGFGSSVTSCANFIGLIHGALSNLAESMNRHNQGEKNRFSRSH